MEMWGVFLAIVATLLIFDLGILNRKTHEISIKESLKLSAFYFVIALLFGLYIWYFLGHGKAIQYYTGYFVEQSLSIDNLFVFSLIFKYFSVPKSHQHRVLFWGIIGVFILRGAMIFLGSILVSSFSWMLYVFGIMLIAMGIKMLFISEENVVLKFVKKYSPSTKLVAVIIMISIADVIFAIDSIPAIFVITTDPYIVYTSNIFAVLGLRALYFALEVILSRFIYLQQALAIILIFIGSKVFIGHITPVISLGVTLGLLAIGIGFSLWKTRLKA